MTLGFDKASQPTGINLLVVASSFLTLFLTSWKSFFKMEFFYSGFSPSSHVTLPSSETNSTCKLTVLRIEPHVIPAHKRMRIIPCYFLTELHDLRLFLLSLNLIPTITWLMMPKCHCIIYSPCSVLSFPA